MLEMLNGRTHEVVTAYAIYDRLTGNVIRKSASTQVKFKKIKKEILATYADTEDPLDKAGSYSVQGYGTFLVDSINGSFNNVVGLPIEMVIEDLLKLDCLTV